MMDLKTIRAELRKLTAIVDGWEPSGEIPALERDLALEKLRTLYDAVRFTEVESLPEFPVAETEPAAAPVPIDLGAVLSLDPTDEAVFEPGPDAVSGPAFDAEAEPAEPFSEPDTTVAADSAGAFAGGNPDTETPGMAEPAVSDSEPELEGESGFEPDPEAASEAAFVAGESEPAAESGPVAASESDAVPEPSAKPVAAPGPAAAAEPVVVPEPAPAPAPEPAPAEKPQYIAPTLFGLEEETVRHRHKQRVIMSLYNTEPAAPAPKPASVPALEPTGKPVAGGKPAAEASFAQPAVAGSASSGSAASDSASAGTAAAGVSVSDATAGAALSATPFTAPVTEPAASATTPVGSVTTSLGSATTSAPGPDAFASRTPVAAPQPKAAETTAPDNAGDDDEPDFEEITLEAKNTSGAVLGEVINHNVQTLADTIAPPRDVASELRRSEHVTDLRRAIGINDKFLMIRDLFGGDAAAYEAAIGTLNGFDDFDECMIYIAENYAWNANSDGAKFLMELLERKFA